MKTIHVLSAARFTDEQLAQLRAVSSRLELVQHTGREADQLSPDFWHEVEVLCTFGKPPAPDQVPNLRWVQLMSAGADHVVDLPVFSDDVILTTTSGIHAINIGELVLAMMLVWGHRLLTMMAYQRKAEWPENRSDLFLPQELRGATVGIVGYGSIGREVGRLTQALGMRVMAFDESDDPVDLGYTVPGVGDPEGAFPQKLYRPGELKSMLAECDYVVLALPLGPASRGIFGRDELQAMKSSAFLVNIGRGGVVDESMLVQALQEGWIAGAGLDVFEEEPLPASSPLWGMPNVILTPHIAGATPHYHDRAAVVFAENLLRYVDGRPLLNQVDLNKGY
jgi:phosphoglycerate dehydrogenase-like enzyme